MNSPEVDDNRVYNDPPIREHVHTGVAGMTDSPATPMEKHAAQLDIVADGLERACLQYSNAVARMRGDHPSEQGANKLSTGSEALLSRMGSSVDRLHDVTSRLNNIADEFNELI